MEWNHSESGSAGHVESMSFSPMITQRAGILGAALTLVAMMVTTHPSQALMIVFL
jgi:hypothetical protein